MYKFVLSLIIYIFQNFLLLHVRKVSRDYCVSFNICILVINFSYLAVFKQILYKLYLNQYLCHAIVVNACNLFAYDLPLCVLGVLKFLFLFTNTAYCIVYFDSIYFSFSVFNISYFVKFNYHTSGCNFNNRAINTF